MITEEDLDLVADVLSVLKKHGPDAYQRLHSLIISGELHDRFLKFSKIMPRTNQMMVISDYAAKADRKAPARKQSPRSSKGQEIEDEILMKIRSIASTRQVFKTRRDAIQFASRHGVKFGKKDSRDAIASKIIRWLRTLPKEEFQNQVKSILDPREYEHTLEGWAGLILRKREQSDASSSDYDAAKPVE